MAKKATLSVNDYMDQLTHPLKAVVFELRNAMKENQTELTEHIKWNSLSYFYDGVLNYENAKEYTRDALVVNTANPKYLLFIFPSGHIIEHPPKELEGEYADGRRMIKISSMEEFSAKKAPLFESISGWIIALKNRQEA